MTAVFSIPVRPKSVESLSRYAWKLHKLENIPHHEALERVAKMLGYSNYRHAKRELEAKLPLRALHRIFLTCYWSDPRTGDRGHQTVSVDFENRLRDIVGTHETKRVRTLADFVVVADDHLQRVHTLRSSDAAKDAVLTGARTLQFMDATGLRALYGPKVEKLYPDEDVGIDIPGLDHSSNWQLPGEEMMLMLDEPYADAVAHYQKAREAFARRYEYKFLSTTWPGIWAPPETMPVFILPLRTAGKFEALVSKIESIRPVQDTSVEAGPFRPLFVSPAGLASRRRARAPVDPARRRRVIQGKTRGYSDILGGSARRPDGRMPIDIHRRIGKVLKTIHAMSYCRKGVYNRVDSVRHELDAWVQREYDRQALSDDQFFTLYSGGERPKPRRRIEPHESALLAAQLSEVQRLVAENYPNCAPRRKLISKLLLAEKSMRAWAG